MGKKRWDAKSIIGLILLITLLGSIIYAAIGWALAPETASQLESAAAATTIDAAAMLPGLGGDVFAQYVGKKMDLAHYGRHVYLYFLFLYCAIYLGEVRNFFYVVPHWILGCIPSAAHVGRSGLHCGGPAQPGGRGAGTAKPRLCLPVCPVLCGNGGRILGNI